MYFTLPKKRLLYIIKYNKKTQKLLNMNINDYGNDTLNRLDVSFLPGDIVPSVINRTSTTIMKNNEEDVSFM